MRVYAAAAWTLERLEKEKSSVKTLVYGNAKDDAKRTTLALVSGVLTQRHALEEALRASGTWVALEREGVVKTARQRTVALLAAYDVASGKGLPKRAGGRLARVLKRHSRDLSNAFQPVTVKAKARRRFARCNRLAGATVSSVIAALRRADEEADEERRRSPTEDVREDELVPGLVEFPARLARTVNATHELVTSGQLVLQDKASCLPALALTEGPAVVGDVLDMCAAPGNKTTQLAALLSDGQRVFALDRDPKRLETLVARVREAHAAKRVECRLQNCLEATGAAFPSVTSILLDPSCSGSGIGGRRGEACDADRLRDLASFQLKALTVALAAFPNVDRVVYSTCSVHAAENEDVVAAALRQHPHFALEKCLPRWPRRGSSPPHGGLSSREADAVLRVDPDADNLVGFFVAKFVRRRVDATTTRRRRLVRKLQLLRRRFLGRLLKRALASEEGESSDDCDRRTKRRRRLPMEPPRC